jgi:hypothetical protein
VIILFFDMLIETHNETVMKLPRRAGKTTWLRNQVEHHPARTKVIVCSGRRSASQWQEWIQHSPVPVHQCRAISSWNQAEMFALHHECRTNPDTVAVFVDNAEFTSCTKPRSFMWHNISALARDMVITETGL